MKKILSIILLAFGIVLGVTITGTNNNVSAEEEMRAAWVSTVINIDWPTKGSQGNVAAQKQEYIRLVDKLKSAGINTIVIQVRPESDTIYKSNINPWSRFLTGVQGKDPGYDPLEFIINESHNRGMKVHAWFNPYRASFYNDLSSTASSNPLNIHRDWVINYKNKWYYDPGLPEVRQYIVDTVSEVVRNYDVDGIHFDDYFYPAPDFNDDKSFATYGSGNRDAWRRNNVNMMIGDVHNAVKAIKPNVDFGVSPAGIWRNKSNDANGSNTSGGESYSKHYADTRYWIKNNLVDYVVPQVYWKIGHPKADYATLIKWWSEQVRGTGVKLYIGQGLYKHGQSEYGGENVAAEIKQQIILNRKYPEIKGSIHFSAKNIIQLPQVFNDLKSVYTLSTNEGNNGVNNNSNIDANTMLPYQNELKGADRAETAIQISKKSWPNGTSTVILMNGKDTLNAVIASPYAALKNAPILLSFGGKVSDNTINEIRRLKATNIVVIGGTSSVSQMDINRLKAKVSSITIERINISEPEKLSVEIFSRLMNNETVESVYITSKNALPDVLSIAAKAGNQKSPILVSSSTKLSNEAINVINKSGTDNIYFIGGPRVLSGNVVKQVEKVRNRSFADNWIYGDDRIDTNTKVIERLYKNSDFQKAFLTRSDAPIDAITVSPFAQRSDSPIILVGKSVPNSQNQVLKNKSASLVYRVGGGINSNSYSIIHKLLAK